MREKYDYNLGLVLKGEDAKKFDEYMSSDWDTEAGRKMSRIAHRVVKELGSKKSDP